MEREKRHITMKGITYVIITLVTFITIVGGCATMIESMTKPTSYLVVNNTGRPIIHMYKRDTGTLDWGNVIVQESTANIDNTHSFMFINADDQNRRELIRELYLIPRGGSFRFYSNTGVVDIKVIDDRDMSYGIHNVNIDTLLTSSEPFISISSENLYPTLTIQNLTGYTVNITSPNEFFFMQRPVTQMKTGREKIRNPRKLETDYRYRWLDRRDLPTPPQDILKIDNNESAIYQLQELSNPRDIIISYFISTLNGDSHFSIPVNLDTLSIYNLKELPPKLTVKNSTNYSIENIKILSSPNMSGITLSTNGDQSYLGLIKPNSTFTITYSIENLPFTEKGNVADNSIIVNIIRGPIKLSVKNNTGFMVQNIRIIDQNDNILTKKIGNYYGGYDYFNERVQNKEINQPTYVYPDAEYSIYYESGGFAFKPKVKIQGQDMIMSITSHAPFLTIVNNTGKRIDNISIRKSGTNDSSGDLLYMANRDGTHKGWLENNERFRIWLGSVDIRGSLLPYGRTDVRLDDVQRQPYIKRGLTFNSDTVITFTSSDKI